MDTIEVHPKGWVLPNRVGFTSFLARQFRATKYSARQRTQTCEAPKKQELVPEELPVDTLPKKIHLFPHQRFLRDYMQTQSPYHGILFYHGLGTGKTASSIAAAEGFIAQKKKVFVLLPASLEPNFKAEILRAANLGLLKRRLWASTTITDDTLLTTIRTHYDLDRTWLEKHRKEVWLPLPLPEGVSATHTDKRLSALTEKQKQGVFETLEHMLDQRYTFIRYNGLTKKSLAALGDRPFDNAFVIMDEAHNFVSRVTNGGIIAKSLYHMLMDAKDMKMVLLSGTPAINNPFELCYLLNLVRGPIPIHTVSFTKDIKIPSQDQIVQWLKDANLLSSLDTYQLRLDKGAFEFTFLPDHFLRQKSQAPLPIQYDAASSLPAQLVQRIQKVFEEHGIRLAKSPLQIETSYALPIHTKEFEELYLDTTDPDHPKVKNPDLFMRRIQGTVSYFRTAGEELFPTEHPMQIEKVPFSEYSFSQYVTVRDKERKMEQRRKQKAAMEGVFGSKGTVYRAFSRMCCNFVFPDKIKRLYPMELRKALHKEIDATEDEKREDKREEEVPQTIEEKERKLLADYEGSLRLALQELEEGGEEYLTIEALRKYYSPKYATVLERLEECPGKALVYSQFRSVEGLGVFSLALKANGYIPIELEKHGKNWRIVNQEEVMDPIYDGKRFILFPENREKAAALLSIYNGRSELVQQPNLRGELCKVLLISMSAAEGISLKNVRQTHILESFWNKTKIEQVIGRAVRTCSHSELPLDERDVQVYMYLADFTPAQLKSNFTLRRQDQSLTSDAHLWQLAAGKDAILQEFLFLMKKAAIDCVIFAQKNKPLTRGYSCYSFPIPSKPTELAYTASVRQDKKDDSIQKKVALGKLKGVVVKIKDQKYVYVAKYNKLYDYAAWIDAGTPIEVPVAIPV